MPRRPRERSQTGECLGAMPPLLGSSSCWTRFGLGQEPGQDLLDLSTRIATNSTRRSSSLSRRHDLRDRVVPVLGFTQDVQDRLHGAAARQRRPGRAVRRWRCHRNHLQDPVSPDASLVHRDPGPPVATFVVAVAAARVDQLLSMVTLTASVVPEKFRCIDEVRALESVG
jgi:hypothetical protein